MGMMLIVPLVIAGLFGIVFATKEALFEWRSRRIRAGGFEVKLITGEPPVLLKEKDNDHG